VIAARRSAAAATVSAAATANRAETPEPWSTALDSRSDRVSRATISRRCRGTSATSFAYWVTSAISSASSSG